MSTVTLKPDDLYTKDTNEQRLIIFDWDAESLAAAVTISTSTWVLTCVRPSSETPVNLANSSASILSGSRKTQTLLTAGTLGSRYKVTNRIVTNESPAQTKERSVFVDVVDQ